MAASVTRRDALKAVIVTGVAAPAVFGVAGPTAAASEEAVIVGFIRSTSDDRLIIDTPSRVVEVFPASGARMYSGAYGEVSSIHAFYVGDRIVAKGAYTAQGFIATDVGSAFSPLKARIDRVSPDGSVAHSTAGPLLLTAGELPSLPDSDLGEPRNDNVRPGSVIEGLEWTNPSTGQRYLLVMTS